MESGSWLARKATSTTAMLNETHQTMFGPTGAAVRARRTAGSRPNQIAMTITAPKAANSECLGASPSAPPPAAANRRRVEVAR